MHAPAPACELVCSLAGFLETGRQKRSDPLILLNSRSLGPIAVATFLAVAAMFSPPLRAEEETLVTVNGRAITQADVRLAETEIGPQLASVPVAERRRVVIEYLIDNTLMAEAGAKANMSSGDGFEQRLAYYKQRALRDAYFDKNVMDAVTDVAAKTIYDQQVGSVTPKEEIHARHILVKTEEDAADVVERLNRGAEFAELASELSIGPSKTQGGDLGYFTKGQMVKAFETAAFDLKKGDVSEPVKTQFGWHVIKLEDRRMQQVPTFESLKDRIRASLIGRKAQEVIKSLRKEAKLEFVNKELEKDLKSAARGSFGLE